MGGGAAMGMCLIPGMPPIPFLIIGGMVFFAGLRAKAEEPEGTDGMLAVGAAPENAPSETSTHPHHRQALMHAATPTNIIPSQTRSELRWTGGVLLDQCCRVRVHLPALNVPVNGGQIG